MEKWKEDLKRKRRMAGDSQRKAEETDLETEKGKGNMKGLNRENGKRNGTVVVSVKENP